MINLEKYYKYGFFIAILAIMGLVYKSCSDAKSYRDMQTQESNLRKALTDSSTHFRTKEGAWGEQKRSLQTDLDNLKDKNLNLTANQKALVKEVERQNKNAQVIAAALIDLKAEVANWKDNHPIEETDSSVRFAETTKDFVYDLTIANVKPIELKIPTLTFNKVSFPNTQTINFHWKDDRKEGYPTEFSVINTNQYFKVNDIQSYVIPEIKKEDIKPNFWQKLGKFSKTTGGKLVFFGAGVVVGAAIIK